MSNPFDFSAFQDALIGKTFHFTTGTPDETWEQLVWEALEEANNGARHPYDLESTAEEVSTLFPLEPLSRTSSDMAERVRLALLNKGVDTTLVIEPISRMYGERFYSYFIYRGDLYHARALKWSVSEHELHNDPNILGKRYIKMALEVWPLFEAHKQLMLTA